MIPRHSLPFDVRGILSFLVSPAPNTDASEVEKAHADALGVRAVVLFPSVRAGIRMFLRAVGEPDATIAGPAYTCATVHEAMALSSARTRLISPAAELFPYAGGGHPHHLRTWLLARAERSLRNSLRPGNAPNRLPQSAATANFRHGHECTRSEANAATRGQGRCAFQLRSRQADVRRLGRRCLLAGPRTG